MSRAHDRGFAPGQCSHGTTHWEVFDAEHPISGEVNQQHHTSHTSYFVDLDWGRYQCTRCAEVRYYTGSWKDYWERGIPCPGSSLVPANLRPVAALTPAASSHES